MRALRKFLALPIGDRILVVHSAALLAGVFIGLHMFPFRKVLSTVDRLSRRVLHPGRARRRGSARIVWAVLAVSRHAPLTLSCLVQALAAKIVLSREGYPALVRIGVAQTGGGRLRAHAWLECDGHIVIGDKVVEDFDPLPCFDRG